MTEKQEAQPECDDIPAGYNAEWASDRLESYLPQWYEAERAKIETAARAAKKTLRARFESRRRNLKRFLAVAQDEAEAPAEPDKGAKVDDE